MHTFRAVKFLVMAPVIVAFLFLVNLMTWNGQWWVQWAALGLGIAWVLNLFKVIRALAVAGGLAAISGYLLNRQRR